MEKKRYYVHGDAVDAPWDSHAVYCGICDLVVDRSHFDDLHANIDACDHRIRANNSIRYVFSCRDAYGDTWAFYRDDDSRNVFVGRGAK